MIKFVDDLLNRITMYRLVLYYLIFLLVIAFLMSVVGALSYDPFAMLFSIGFLLAICLLTNRLFASIFKVPANVESAYISALILALILTPIKSFNDLWFLGWAAVWAMASKYIIAIKGKHIFNPVVFAITLTYFTINRSASWWVGNAWMLPFVVIGGLLVVRKIGRFDLVLSFLITALSIVLVTALFSNDFIAAIQNAIISSAILFFAFIILTEPLTTPPTRTDRIYYGILVGFLYAPQFHIGTFYLTPELAILIGNIYSYLVSPKTKLVLRLKEKTRISPDTFDFVFAVPRDFKYKPGQFMEWTLGNGNADSRGNRRYFTIASAPTEHNLRLGIKFNQRSSTFKKALLSMGNDSEIIASQLAGDFVLPNGSWQKCVFIAGGIGITPFRSMLKYLLDTCQPRPITLFYANKSIDDIVYKDILYRADRELGIRTIYAITDKRNTPPNWTGWVGRLTPEIIRSTVPDFRNCTFYLSGPRGMVDSFKDSLRRLNIQNSRIKTDYFAGLA
jgi:ferredoxin-NADP reductase/Na+-translocating ferredoxin:NAD+ oxidoreductase RnfD subunit